MAAILRRYRALATSHPLPTEAAMTAFMFGLGDALSQHLVERTPHHDYRRTLRSLLFGGLSAGPMLSTWYGQLNRRVVLRDPLPQLLARVALDQLVFTPVFVSAYFVQMGLLEGRKLPDLWLKLKETFPSTIVANWAVWVPVQCINFYFTPPPLRLLVVNTTATAWNTYLAYTNSRANRKLDGASKKIDVDV
ncbi:hypothetical protein DFJ74DRAFT_658903 [Hyaloraphidium curvatum]|nr:hypothetical protein DFJ74DRAFT_658903 [Hyaloraphidium curvatum]